MQNHAILKTAMAVAAVDPAYRHPLLELQYRVHRFSPAVGRRAGWRQNTAKHKTMLAIHMQTKLLTSREIQDKRTGSRHLSKQPAGAQHCQ